MRTKQRTVSNVQALSESKRCAIRRKIYTAYSEGLTKYAAAQKFHIHERTVGRWYKKFDEYGEVAVHGNKRGPKAGGKQHKLSDEQMKALRKVVIDKTPDQLKFDFALWSSKAIKEYVQTEYGQTITRRTARRYMQKMGFSYQCPVKFAREQQPAQVKKWLDETYPEIKKEAAKCGASIMWADESSILSAETKARGYSPIGIAPVLRSPANRSIRCSMISAVGNKGDMQFMIFEGAMNVDIFKDFIVRLTKESSTQIFLVVDNLRVHHAKCLESWLKEHEKEVRLFYLPSYSPELNPDEYLNRDLKATMAEQARPANKKALRLRVESHLEARRNDRDAVKRLFQKPEVLYAAD